MHDKQSVPSRAPKATTTENGFVDVCGKSCRCCTLPGIMTDPGPVNGFMMRRIATASQRNMASGVNRRSIWYKFTVEGNVLLTWVTR